MRLERTVQGEATVTSKCSENTDATSEQQFVKQVDTEGEAFKSCIFNCQRQKS